VAADRLPPTGVGATVVAGACVVAGAFVVVRRTVVVVRHGHWTRIDATCSTLSLPPSGSRTERPSCRAPTATAPAVTIPAIRRVFVVMPRPSADPRTT
jgi:hypothetical protein